MLDIHNIGMETTRWKRKWRLILAFILIAVGAYGNSRAAFGDTIATVLIATGVGLLFTNLLRTVIYKDEEELAADEMTKRISGASSDVAFVVTIAAIGVLSMIVKYRPAAIDAGNILLYLLVVMALSKIAAEFYYKRMKKGEI